MVTTPTSNDKKVLWLLVISILLGTLAIAAYAFSKQKSAQYSWSPEIKALEPGDALILEHPSLNGRKEERLWFFISQNEDFLRVRRMMNNYPVTLRAGFLEGNNVRLVQIIKRSNRDEYAETVLRFLDQELEINQQE